MALTDQRCSEIHPLISFPGSFPGQATPGQEYAGSRLRDRLGNEPGALVCATLRTCSLQFRSLTKNPCDSLWAILQRRTLYAVMIALSPYIGVRLLEHMGKLISRAGGSALAGETRPKMKLATYVFFSPITSECLVDRDSRRDRSPRWKQLLHTVWPAVTRGLARFPAVHLAAYLLLEGAFVTMSQRVFRLTPVGRVCFPAGCGASSYV